MSWLNRRLGIGLLLVVLLSACGGQAPAAPAQPTSAPAAAEPTAAPAAEATAAPEAPAAEPTEAAPVADAPQGGVARIAIQTQPGSFNPVLPAELSASIVNAALFAPLTRMNSETFAIEPYLAKSWEASDDLKVWTFTLQENAVWHDGQPITAEDVKFTFERILDPDEGATNRRDLAGVESIEVIDEHTFKVTLKETDAFFADRLSLGGLEPLPKHLLDGDAPLSSYTDFNTTSPVGSGAFKMKQVVTGSSVELEAFDDFFFGRPKLDGLLFKVVADINQRVVQLRTGDLDWVDIEPVHIAQLEGQPNIEVINAASNRYQIMDWNHDATKWTFFVDPKVRQAMYYAVDRDQILQAVAQGHGVVNDSYVPPTIAWIPPTGIDQYKYDPEKAKALLAEAGWTDTDGDGILDKDGEPFKFYILVDKGNVQREQIGLILQQFYKDIGMDVDYVVGERGGRWIEETNQGTYPVRLAEYPIPHPVWLERIFATGQANNSRNSSNPEVDELFKQLSQTADRAEQAAVINKIDALLQADPPSMVIFHRNQYTARNAALKNVPNGELKLSMSAAYQMYFER
jgi:peptide/nickel transport system substrate-binding protein